MNFFRLSTESLEGFSCCVLQKLDSLGVMGQAMGMRSFRSLLQSQCRPLILSSTLLFLSGCGSRFMSAKIDMGGMVAATQQADFIPIDPLDAADTTVVDSKGTRINTPWAILSTDQIRKMLVNQGSVTASYKLDEDGKATYLVASATGSKGEYRLVMDYAWYRSEDLIDSQTGRVVGVGRVGVGLRVSARFITKKADIDLSSLFALGLAAKSGLISGQMRVDVLGVTSPDIVALFPTSTTAIDETAVQKALESQAAIKAKFADQNITLAPQLLAVKLYPQALLTRKGQELAAKVEAEMAKTNATK